MLISRIGKELGKKNYNKLGPIISKYNPPKLNVNKFYKNEFKFYNRSFKCYFWLKIVLRKDVL